MLTGVLPQTFRLDMRIYSLLLSGYSGELM